MPLQLVPTLVGITGRENINKHAVSFSYNFVGDTPKPINIGGVTFQGSQYVLDVSSIPSNVANLGDFKSMQISVDFDSSQVNELDGELIAIMSGTGQIVRFCSNPGIAPDGIANAKAILTAVVPIVTNAPTKIIFAKAVNSGGAMFGLLNVTIFDFHLPPYVFIGAANDANT